MEIRECGKGLLCLPGWRRALTPFPGPSSLCLACQRQPVLVWLLSSPRYHLQLFVLCLLLIVYWGGVIIALHPAGPWQRLLGFPALLRLSLNLGVRAPLGGCRSTWAQNPSVFASRSGGRMWNLHVWGGGRDESLGLCVKLLKCYWLGI